jgi:hypothetical protein
LTTIVLLSALAGCGNPCSGDPELTLVDDLEGGDVAPSRNQMLGHLHTQNPDQLCEQRVGQAVANLLGTAELGSVKVYSSSDLSDPSLLAESDGQRDKAVYLVRSDNNFWLTLGAGKASDLYFAATTQSLPNGATFQLSLRGILYKTSPSPKYDEIRGTPQQATYNVTAPEFKIKR